MKEKLLAAAVLGCLLCTPMAEARHLAEQQQARLESILGGRRAAQPNAYEVHRANSGGATAGESDKEAATPVRGRIVEPANTDQAAGSDEAAGSAGAQSVEPANTGREDGNNEANNPADAEVKQGDAAETIVINKTEHRYLTPEEQALLNRLRRENGMAQVQNEAEQSEGQQSAAAPDVEAQPVEPAGNNQADSTNATPAIPAVAQTVEPAGTNRADSTNATPATPAVAQPVEPAGTNQADSTNVTPATPVVAQPVEPATAKPADKPVAKPPRTSFVHPAAKKPVRLKVWDMDALDGGGTLLFSSSPEYVKTPGLLYADVLRGKGRVLYYHVNETKEPCHLLVVLENKAGRPATVHISRGAEAKPSADYLGVGKDTQLAYFGKPMDETVVVPKNGRVLLRKQMGKTVMKPDDLIYGVYDIETDEMVRISFVLAPVKENPLEYAAKAPLLQRSQPSAGRGTFNGMDRTLKAKKVYNPKKDGPVCLIIGDDDEDLFVNGIDATDGSVATNYGNYGINYYISVPLSGKGGAKAWLDPEGGVYAGAIALTGADKAFGKMVATPAGKVFFGEAEENAAPAEAEIKAEEAEEILTLKDELAEITDIGAAGELSFIFSPPGASNLPLRVILIPDLAKKKKKG